MNPNPTFFEIDPTTVARAAEVPNANFNNGCNAASSCSPGIGINMNGGAVVGSDEQFTLLDQDEDPRTPQVGQYVGGAGFVNRAVNDWPSSGGLPGKGTAPIRDCTPGNGDGVVTIVGDATLADLAVGWVSDPPP